jgi:uncharacterized protein with PIN domain
MKVKTDPGCSSSTPSSAPTTGVLVEGAVPALLADAMLGRLARWLRLLGYDTLYAERWSDHRIAARARAEGRVVLTRDRGLLRRRGIRCLAIRSQDVEEQIAEVARALGAPPAQTRARCSRCNTPLRAVAPASVRAQVPPYVYRTQERFYRCEHCDKLYWAGTHWRNVRAVADRVLGGTRSHGS